jgi:L-threonylcarbamoyladenylate synthase
MIDKEVDICLKTLQYGGIILYPTDTVWGIGCDATNFMAIEKIFQLKKRHESKSMICLVSDINMLKQYVKNVPEAAYDILKYSDKPTTIIYDDPINVAENLIAKDNTLAIRIIKDEFCNELIKKLKRPLVSTSANISGDPTPGSFKEITPDILKGVDYIVNLHRDKKTSNPSSIIKLGNDGTVNIIRE